MISSIIFTDFVFKDDALFEISNYIILFVRVCIKSFESFENLTLWFPIFVDLKI